MARLVVPAVVEPMTAAEVRLRLKYPRTDQDEAITEWIRAARDAVERYVERGLLTQTLELQTYVREGGVAAQAAALVGGESTQSNADAFVHNLTTFRSPRLPASVQGAPVYGAVDLVWAAPLQAVESITDDDGPVPATAYAVDDTVEPARLYFLDAARPAGVATVRYRVGFGETPFAIPPTLRQVVFALVQQYFLFRAGPPPQSALAQTLVQADGYRVRSFA
jgi:hypothetical protein